MGRRLLASKVYDVNEGGALDEFGRKAKRKTEKVRNILSAKLFESPESSRFIFTVL